MDSRFPYTRNDWNILYLPQCYFLNSLIPKYSKKIITTIEAPQIFNLKQYLIKSISGIFVLRVAGVALGIISSIVFARLMGPDEYGRYSFALETMMFISIPVALGLPQLLTREVSKYNASQDYTHLKGLLRWSGLFSSIAAIGFIILTAVVVSFSESDPYKKLLFYFALPIIALRGIGQVRLGALRGLKEPIRANFPDSVLRPGLTVALIGTLFFVFEIEINAKIALISMDVALLVSFILGVFWLYRALPENAKRSDAYNYENRYWVKEAVPFFFLGGIAIVNSRLSMVLAGVYLPDAEVGFYKIALTASTLVSFFLTAVNTTISPLISEMYVNRQFDRLQKMLTATVRVIFSTSVLISIIYIFFGKSIIGIFYGSDFLPAYAPLIILTIGQLINSGAGSVGSVLSMMGHQSDTLKGHSISAIANIVLCFVLIPKFGIIGAAISTAASLLLWNVILIGFLKRRSQLKTTVI